MSNGLNLNSIMNTAMFAAGFVTGGATWAALAQQLATQVFQQLATQAFSQALDQMGIGGPMKDLMMNAFSQGLGGADSGNFGQDVLDAVIDAANQNADGQYTGELDRAQADLAKDMVQFLAEQGLEREDGEDRATSRNGGTSWLRAMAEVLGRKLDAAAHEMTALANQVNKEDPSTMTDFQVASQEFGILMNATSTAIKAIGEGLQNISRKQ